MKEEALNRILRELILELAMDLS